MPEVAPEKNLEPYKQCEIRRPSPPRTLKIDGKDIYFAGGYYYDIVWIKEDLAQRGRKIADGEGNEWLIAEVFGLKQMSRTRGNFKASK